MATTKEETRPQAEVNPRDPYHTQKIRVTQEFKDIVRNDPDLGLLDELEDLVVDDDPRVRKQTYESSYAS